MLKKFILLAFFLPLVVLADMRSGALDVTTLTVTESVSLPITTSSNLSLKWGDGDTGFYEATDGQLELVREGVRQWYTLAGTQRYLVAGVVDANASALSMTFKGGSAATDPGATFYGNSHATNAGESYVTFGSNGELDIGEAGGSTVATFSSTGLAFPNNIFLYGNETGGVSKRLIGFNSSDDLQIGEANGAYDDTQIYTGDEVQILYGAGSNYMIIDESSMRGSPAISLGASGLPFTALILRSPDGSSSSCTVDNSDNLTCTGL